MKPHSPLQALARALTSTTMLLCLAAALSLSALIGRVVARTTLVRLGYELSALNKKNQQLTSELNALRTELAARRAPDALAKEASARFGLYPPTATQLISIRQPDGAQR